MRKSLEALTVKELRAEATRLKIEGRSKLTTKKQLIDALSSKTTSRGNVPANVLDAELYRRVREKVKKTVEHWPSAYASGLVVQAYKKAGGRYSGEKGGGKLDRWYREKWVNVCEKSKGKYLSCSSKDSTRYPYCRPSVRVNRSTPKTASELTKKQLLVMCAKKRSQKRVFVD